MRQIRPRQGVLATVGGAFVALFIGATALLGVLSAVVYLPEARDQRRALMAAEAHKVDHQKHMVALQIENTVKDLLVLASHQEVPLVRDWDAKPSLDKFASELLTFAQAKRHVDQVRLLDNHGREVIRIDRDSGKPEIRPLGELQDKSSREYFIAATRLSRHQVYVSPLEINREHGQVSMPPKAVIRFATPVFDAEGHRGGILMLNLPDNYIEAIHGAPSSNGNPPGLPYLDSRHRNAPMLVNLGQNNLDTHPNRPHAGLILRELARRGVGNINGPTQYLTPAGLFTYDIVRPDLSTVTTDLPTAPYTAAAPTNDWLLVSYLPAAVVNAATAPLRHFILRADLLLVLVLGAISWVLAKEMVERRRTMERLEESERRHRSVTESANDGIVATDAGGTILSWNRAAGRLFGVDEKHALGQPLTDFIPDFIPDFTPNSHRATDPGNDGNSGKPLTGACAPGQTTELSGRRADGHTFPLAFSMATWRVDRRTYFCGIIRDISERKAFEAKLEHMAITDGLTGLSNRAYFETRYNLEFRRARRYGTGLSLMLIDIDLFKSVNDLYGHPVGDQCLAKVAKVIAETCRDTDTVARYGGEEFAVILPNTDREGCATLAERIRSRVEQCNLAQSGEAIHRTLSIGVVHVAADITHITQEKLLNTVDKALYEAKNKGRNQVVMRTCGRRNRAG